MSSRPGLDERGKRTCAVRAGGAAPRLILERDFLFALAEQTPNMNDAVNDAGVIQSAELVYLSVRKPSQSNLVTIRCVSD